MEIRWEDPNTQARYEEMVAVLIKRIHRRAQRIHGRGGDEGRDVQVPTLEGLSVYELKSFAGRLREGGRKAQIKRSLQRASALRPCEWHLVVPIDPTPSELRWFESLAKEYSFPCYWLGRTWLNSELSKRQDIPKYFLETPHGEVLRLLQQLLGEDFAPDDAGAALERAGHIRSQLNDFDPYFEYALSLGGVSPGSEGRPDAVFRVQVGHDRIDVVPRYATALVDHPITVETTFRFGSQDSEHREALDRSIRFGDPVVLPSSVVQEVTIRGPGGLGGEFDGCQVSLGSHEIEIDDPILVQLHVYGPDRETLLASHEFKMTQRRTGTAGGVLFGSDATGLLKLEVRGDLEEGNFHLNLQFSFTPVLPDVGIIAARWLAHVRPPNCLAMSIAGSEASRDVVEINEPLIESPEEASDTSGGDMVEQLYAAFRSIQERAGTAFDVPADLTPDEFEQALYIAALLSPEKHRYEWSEHTFTYTDVESPEQLGDLLTRGGNIVSTCDFSWEFRGRTLDLGRLARILACVPVDGASACDAIERGQRDGEVQLVPGSSNVVTEWLMQPDDPLLAA